MTFGSSLPLDDFTRLLKDRGTDFTLIGHALHTAAKADLLRRSDNVPTLTARERDCLLAVMSGARPEQIGDQLKIATVTVNLHLRNARRKLGVRTLPEAIACALRYGELKL